MPDNCKQPGSKNIASKFSPLVIKMRLTYPASYSLNVFWIQDRDQFCLSSRQSFHIVIQLHPIKTAMLRIWIDANDRPCEPAFTFPKFGIEKNLHPVADFELLCHMHLFAAG